MCVSLLKGSSKIRGCPGQFHKFYFHSSRTSVKNPKILAVIANQRVTSLCSIPHDLWACYVFFQRHDEPKNFLEFKLVMRDIRPKVEVRKNAITHKSYNHTIFLNSHLQKKFHFTLFRANPCQQSPSVFSTLLLFSQVLFFSGFLIKGCPWINAACIAKY